MSIQNTSLYEIGFKVLFYTIESHRIQRFVKEKFHNEGAFKNTYYRDQLQDLLTTYENETEEYRFIKKIQQDCLDALNNNDSDLNEVRKRQFLNLMPGLFDCLMEELLINEKNSVFSKKQLILMLINHALGLLLRFNLESQEIEFLTDQLIAKYLRENGNTKFRDVFALLHDSDNKSALNLYQYRYNQENTIYYNDSLHEKIDAKFGTRMCDSIDLKNKDHYKINVGIGYSSEFIENCAKNIEKQLSGFFEKIKIKIDRIYEKHHAYNGDGERDKGNIHLTHLAALNFLQDYYNLQYKFHTDEESESFVAIKEPLRLMKVAKDMLFDNLAKSIKPFQDEFLGLIACAANNAVEKKSEQIDDARARLMRKSLHAVVQHVETQEFKRQEKLFWYIFGGALLGAIALSLFVCTGGLSIVAYAAFHLLYVAPLVQGLIIAGGGLLGASFGFGAKKVADKVGAEYMTVKVAETTILQTITPEQAKEIKAKSPVSKLREKDTASLVEIPRCTRDDKFTRDDEMFALIR